MLAQLRLELAAGALALAVGLVGQSAAGSGREPEIWLGLAAFATYLVCAIGIAGLSAHRSKMSQWRLAGFDVASGVTGEWSRMGTDLVLVALVVAALSTAVQLMSAARALAAGAWESLILPLLRLLPWSWFKVPPPKTCTSSSCARGAGGVHALVRPRILPHVSQTRAGIWDILGNLWQAFTRLIMILAEHWPLLLCIAALLALARIYVSSSRGRALPSLWLSVLGALRRCFHLMRVLLLASGGSIAARSRALAARGSRQAGAAVRRWRGPNLDDMSARQAVITVYLTALRHAGRRGFTRRAGQTPAEYARELAVQVPEAGEPAGDLAETFVAARYGLAPVESAQVDRARTLWHRFRTAMRGRRGRGSTGA